MLCKSLHIILKNQSHGSLSTRKTSRKPFAFNS